jgi:hypothetical protein
MGSTSATGQNAWLACDVPAFGVGYTNAAVPPPNSSTTPPLVSSFARKPNLSS